jgi:hypothetical protein
MSASNDEPPNPKSIGKTSFRAMHLRSMHSKPVQRWPMQRWGKSPNQARMSVDRIVFRWDIERLIAKSIAIHEAKPNEANPN